MIQRRIYVSGRVQGVSFRASTVREAARLGGMKGFVRNLEDGRVEVLACGSREAVLGLIEWCRKGPPGARVSEIEVREEASDPALPPFGIDR